MMVEELPAGVSVFLDANIFIYHFAGLSNDCTELLLDVEDQRLSGLTSTIVLAEVCHRRMVAEAVEAHHLQPRTALRRLKENPDLAKGLSRYQEDIRKIPKMGVGIRPVLLQDIWSSERERLTYGLLTNDSINLALLRRLRVKYLATCDRDFSRVDGMAVWKPKDLVIPQ